MILKAFSEYAKAFNAEIPTVILLSKWLKEKLSKEPESNVERIIHTEIGCLKNKQGIFMLIGKTQSGRVLMDSLYEYALSYEHHKFNKWVHGVKASDFAEE